MMAMSNRGYFIVFEGVDGGGKSTQIKMLSEFFKEVGYDVELHMEPTHESIGSLLWTYMRSKNRSFNPETEALLFAADRIEHGKTIQRALDEGKVIISDRYLHSSLAYQGAAGVDVEWMKSLNRHALKPDLVILLDIDPEKSLERVSDRDKTVFEESEYLKRVRAEYLRYADAGELTVIDATQPIMDVHAEIKRLIERLFE
ncbi:dTMP kinase [Candidatus Bathyarchaeota archaeon]|nr:dTMP kinase [Candidatus Bathyarchaeota archaeon]